MPGASNRLQLTRRRVLAAGGTLALSGCLGGGNTKESPPEPDTAVANTRIPENPGSYTYATAGVGDQPTVTYFGSWKCPYCAEFSTGFLGDIITDYVEPGDIDLRFRALAYIDGNPFLGPDAPRAARAGLAVWNVDPVTCWKYHEYVFANQPPERDTWAKPDKLVSFMQQTGVTGVEKIRTKLQSQAYESALQATSRAAADAGISGTPALLIDGKTVNPLGDPDRTRTLIEQLIDGT